MFNGKVSFEEAVQVIRENNLRVLNKYLENGLDPEMQDQHGKALITEAAICGNDDVFAKMLAMKVEINKCYNGRTLLSYAVQADNFDTVCLLVINGADVNKCDKDGTSPLCEALERGFFDIADFLMRSGAKYDVNKWGLNPLMDFNEIPNDTIDLLASSGMDVNYLDAKSKFGTLLNWTIARNASGSIDMLLTLGADPNMAGLDGMPALHYAVVNGANADVVRKLIDAGAEVNAIDGYGNTPLHYIVTRNCDDDVIRVLNILLHNGADPRKKNVYGETPYQIAARKLANNVNSRVMWTIRSYAT